MTISRGWQKIVVTDAVNNADYVQKRFLVHKKGGVAVMLFNCKTGSSELTVLFDRAGERIEFLITIADIDRMSSVIRIKDCI